MRTTEQIAAELKGAEQEIKRIGQYIAEGKGDNFYLFRNGEAHPNWTFKDALTSLISKKAVLEWVLNKH